MLLQVTDPSLLRFLVDLRDADLSDKQLRDDLMTMLIAGHETTAAVLTWTLFALMSNPEVERKMLAEIDTVLGDKTPGERHFSTCKLLSTHVHLAPRTVKHFILSQHGAGCASYMHACQVQLPAYCEPCNRLPSSKVAILCRKGCSAVLSIADFSSC